MTLRGKGITDVVVQSTMLMNGGQTDFVNRECERMRVFYNEMNVGRPLLYTIEDSRFRPMRFPVNMLKQGIRQTRCGSIRGSRGETTRARQYTVNSAICCLRRRGISLSQQSRDIRG